MGWEVRLAQESLGEGAVGPRLAKGTRFPNEIGTFFENEEDAKIAACRWAEWYNKQPYLTKKRKAKYIA
ncbi:MAG: hypothetical protein CMC82_02490 [Flavobacteriaceae bacterium]|nr:hypothetical protein [Flavobacteriaceae bacterium]